MYKSSATGESMGCEDHDEGINAVTQGVVSSCDVAAPYCQHGDYGDFARTYCPKTCGECTGTLWRRNAECPQNSCPTLAKPWFSPQSKECHHAQHSVTYILCPPAGLSSGTIAPASNDLRPLTCTFDDISSFTSGGWPKSNECRDCMSACVGEGSPQQASVLQCMFPCMTRNALVEAKDSLAVTPVGRPSTVRKVLLGLLIVALVALTLGIAIKVIRRRHRQSLHNERGGSRSAVDMI